MPSTSILSEGTPRGSAMSDWLLNLPVLWMAVVVFAATYLLAASIYWNRITLPERSILQRISRLVVPTTVPCGGGAPKKLFTRRGRRIWSDALSSSSPPFRL